MNYEANYWIRTNQGEIVFLGSCGGPISDHDLREGFESLIDLLAKNYPEYLAFNSQFLPEEGASVRPSINKAGENLMVFNLWLANSEPVITTEYLGLNPESMKTQMKVPAHCWRLSRPAYILNIETLLVQMVREFRAKDQTSPGKNLLRFVTYFDSEYDFPYVYGYIRPVESVTIAADKLLEVPDDKYKLEFCNPYQGYYFTIKKTKYDSNDQLVDSDFELL